MEEQNLNRNVIFGDISYESEEHIESIINNMEYQQAVFFITKAIEFSHRSGIYSLTESELISKSLRVFNKKIFLNNKE
jgi:hypothetical protein